MRRRTTLDECWDNAKRRADAIHRCKDLGDTSGADGKTVPELLEETLGIDKKEAQRIVSEWIVLHKVRQRVAQTTSMYVPSPPAPANMALRRRALLISCNEYTDSGLSALRSTTGDAGALAAVLHNRHIGQFDEPVLLPDPSHHQFRAAVETFCREAKPTDTLVLYYSGHGLHDADKQRLFLAAADTDSQRPQATAISANWLVDVLAECPAKQGVVLLDCCYAGLFSAATVAKGTPASVPANGAVGTGWVVLTSSAVTKSYEGKGLDGWSARSDFTRALIEGLETGKADLDGDGSITVDELYAYASRQVTAIGQQRPGRHDLRRQTGEIVLARTPVRPDGVQHLPCCTYDLEFGCDLEPQDKGAFAELLPGILALAGGEPPEVVEQVSRQPSIVRLRGAAVGYRRLEGLAQEGKLQSITGLADLKVRLVADGCPLCHSSKPPEPHREFPSHHEDEVSAVVCRLMRFHGYDKQYDEAVRMLPPPTERIDDCCVYVTHKPDPDGDGCGHFYLHSNFRTHGYIYPTKISCCACGRCGRVGLFTLTVNLVSDNPTQEIAVAVERAYRKHIRFLINGNMFVAGRPLLDLCGAQNVHRVDEVIDGLGARLAGQNNPTGLRAWIGRLFT